MKQLVATICILLVIFVGMLIYKKQQINNRNVSAEEVDKIQEYISNIYMWKEVTDEALPTFENINQAPDKWVWEVVKNNLDKYQVTKGEITEKAKEIFGEGFNKDFPVEGTQAFILQENTNTYIASEINLDNKEDSFFINKIEKTKDGYTVEIVEYLEDYSNVESLTEEDLQKNEEELNYSIYLENLNGDRISELKNNDGETKVIETVKANLDRFTKKVITLEKGTNDSLNLIRVGQ